jgi:hypothetical protein
VTLRLVHSRSMSSAEIERRLEKSTLDLRDAQCQALSPHRRFACAYDAARESVLAFSGATNGDVEYGERQHIAAFKGLLDTIGLAPDLLVVTQQMVRYHYLETELFYRGQTAIDDALAEQAIEWASRLQAAVAEWLCSTWPCSWTSAMLLNDGQDNDSEETAMASRYDCWYSGCRRQVRRVHVGQPVKSVHRRAGCW